MKEHTKDSHKMVNDASVLLYVHGKDVFLLNGLNQVKVIREIVRVL